ncbi:hypothetical protein MPTK1_2g23850 [Marchantia polymorpha subsp. ruderalis]|uniref:RING-type domain-containing protein n=1 Tax=Marchantia polymorpha TaxID=3197 RepID=A0A2R6WPA9_MARPO|nr:hypothetical protein MARPO_0069s0035 [Marchantia polymorpha]BBN03483.1 hypothetical protein Mp_2g23850 [Marchantia polymorpha subsp. ruderalis]|eukprot:PTQ35690.1 hypothetical protein MARPO_0069s0035 [Marchantia polymorpha]
MVVCRCRKATKLYCFVHKAPVCGECISFQEHRLCVVKTYSEWVIDGDYDWPPKCGLCQQVLQETDDTTRLGCFHILHSHCLEAHLRSFPPHTAPAGYVCPSCSTPIWPPKLVKDGSSGLHTKLKQIIQQSDVATTLLGSDNKLVSGQKSPAPPAFSNAPLVSVGNSSAAEESGPTTAGSAGTSLEADGLIGGYATPSNEIVKENVMGSTSGSVLEGEASSSSGPGSSSNPSAVSGLQHFNKSGPVSMQQLLQNGAMARKNSLRGDNMSPSASMGYDDDEDGSYRKYNRRGPFYRQILRTFLPFWSPALPTLPVTAPSHKDSRGAPAAEDLIDGRPRRKQRNSSSMDSRKLLLWFAIMSCMATALLLYYRLAQGLVNSANDDILQGEEQ